MLSGAPRVLTGHIWQGPLDHCFRLLLPMLPLSSDPLALFYGHFFKVSLYILVDII